MIFSSWSRMPEQTQHGKQDEQLVSAKTTPRVVSRANYNAVLHLKQTVNAPHAHVQVTI